VKALPYPTARAYRWHARPILKNNATLEAARSRAVPSFCAFQRQSCEAGKHWRVASRQKLPQYHLPNGSIRVNLNETLNWIGCDDSRAGKLAAPPNTPHVHDQGSVQPYLLSRSLSAPFHNSKVRIDSGAIEQAHMLQSSIGNQCDVLKLVENWSGGDPRPIT
jgi:hypothetical protein